MICRGLSPSILRIGIPTLAMAILWPWQPVFGEGGARRDVLRHAAENAAGNAAPASLSKHATMMDLEGHVLRQGTNSWVCIPDNPDTAGTDPMCMYEPWIGFGEALKNKQPPAYTQVGIAYMLQGNKPTSNTDPYAKDPKPGEAKPGENGVEGLGAHIMELIPDRASLKHIPTNSNNGGPWVMWAETPYAHLMIPIDSHPPQSVTTTQISLRQMAHNRSALI